MYQIIQYVLSLKIVPLNTCGSAESGKRKECKCRKKRALDLESIYLKTRKYENTKD